MAIDYTPGMLEKAAENAAKFIGEKSRNIEFKRNGCPGIGV